MSKLIDAISGVAPLTDALREPAKKRRAPAKAAPKPAVGTSFVCRCGHRTDDQREYQTHLLAEVDDLRSELAEVRGGLPRAANGRRFIAECGTVAGYSRHVKLGQKGCDPCRAANTAKERERRQSPTYLERQNTLKRERDRERMQDPEYRERENARTNARPGRRTPEFRERRNARARERRSREKAERAALKSITPTKEAEQ